MAELRVLSCIQILATSHSCLLQRALSILGLIPANDCATPARSSVNCWRPEVVREGSRHEIALSCWSDSCIQCTLLLRKTEMQMARGLLRATGVLRGSGNRWPGSGRPAVMQGEY
ncbi:hypothetical protein BDV06DRAFT_6636 [Aspergillus oleicola]